MLEERGKTASGRERKDKIERKMELSEKLEKKGR